MLVRLKVSTFADTAGSGVSAAVLVLYFVQARHYETDQVGFLLSLTGIVGAVASVMSARALGRARPLQALIVVYLVQAALAALLALPMALPGTAAVLTLSMLFAQVARSARYRVVTPLDPVGDLHLRARLRVITNAGFGAGALAGGALAGVGTGAYVWALVLNALSFAAAAGVLSTALRAQGPPTVAKDLATCLGTVTAPAIPVALAAAISAGLSFNVVLLNVAVPLIVATSSEAPAWLVGAALAINTGIVIFGQIPAARTVEWSAQIIPAWRRAGMAMAATCVALAFATKVENSWIVAVVLIASAVQTVAELWHQAGYFRYTADLPSEKEATVLSRINAADATVISASPLLVAVILSRQPTLGMILMSGISALLVGLITVSGRWMTLEDKAKNIKRESFDERV